MSLSSNIAATDAQNSEDTLFPEQERMRLPVVRKPLPSTSSETQGERIRVIMEDPRLEFDTTIMSSGLLSRGWVYQEAVLTPANLFCTKNQLWWSCWTSTRSQRVPHGFPTKISSDGTFLWLKPRRHFPYFINRMKEGKNPLYFTKINNWLEILSHYAPTSVTVNDDRLVAIAGIARTLSTGTSGLSIKLREAAYHSGIWSVEICSQLLWKAKAIWKPAPIARFAAAHPIPSWSPASVGAEIVSWDDLESERSLLVTHAKMNTSGVDRFGRANTQSDCVLHLRGILLRVQMCSGDCCVLLLGRGDMASHIWWDTSEEMDMAISAENSGSHMRALVFGIRPLPYKIDEGGRLLLVFGLLLRPLDSEISYKNIQPLWVRVGYFETRLGCKQSLVEEVCQIERYKMRLRQHKDSGCPGWVLEPTGEDPELEDVYIV